MTQLRDLMFTKYVVDKRKSLSNRDITDGEIEFVHQHNKSHNYVQYIFNSESDSYIKLQMLGIKNNEKKIYPNIKNGELSNISNLDLNKESKAYKVIDDYMYGNGVYALTLIIFIMLLFPSLYLQNTYIDGASDSLLGLLTFVVLIPISSYLADKALLLKYFRSATEIYSHFLYNDFKSQYNEHFDIKRKEQDKDMQIAEEKSHIEVDDIINIAAIRGRKRK